MIPLCIPKIQGNEWEYLKECLDTNMISSIGHFVDLFEENFKQYVQSKTAVASMNGTTSLTLALQILGIGLGDEIIVPSMTYVASVNPIMYVNAKPVFVDIRPNTWVMDVDKVEELINKRTKAIIPVHLYGNIVDMEPLLELARKYNLYIIEDATEGLGAKYKTKDGKWHMAGTLGDIGVYSFNGNKLITTGAGGMLVSNNIAIGQKAKYLSNQAKTILDNGGIIHEEIGYNYRMPNLLAAVGVAQLEQINKYIYLKRKQAKLYDELLKEICGIKLVTQSPNVKHGYWLYSILVTDDYSISRDQLIQELKNRNIMTRPFFQPIHAMKPYKCEKKLNLPVTNRISKMGINLPSTVGLNKDEIQYICQCIKDISNNQV